MEGVRYQAVTSTGEEEEVEGGANHGATERYVSEISSSLAVQMLVYYNILLSLVYFFFEGALVTQKLHHYVFSSSLQRLLLLPAFLVWCMAEGFRIYCGYAGNIKEMVPQMSAFLIMTIFPQFCMLLFLTFFQEFVFRADKVLGGMMMIMLLLELILGYKALESITRKRTAQFFTVAQQGNVHARAHQD
ncbi:unnamed protein product [Chrysoparadoxa australica]